MKSTTYGFSFHPKVGPVSDDGFIEDLQKIYPREHGQDYSVNLAADVAALLVGGINRMILDTKSAVRTCSSVISTRSP